MIKVIQLVTAQEIIGEIENDATGDNYLVKDPANIHMIPQGQNGSFGIGLIPFMPYVDGRISISKDKVVITAEPTVEMRNNYSKMFGSGIEIANVMPR
jgi:hypothetical protein